MAPKRARKKKQDIDYAAEELSEDEVESPKPKKKKAASGAVKAKGKASKGPKLKKLQIFQETPLDVLALILSHLDAPTLLSVSRTCRVFRQLTHSNTSKTLWAAARANTIGKLPDLTATDLEDWKYASLIYDRTCHGCGKPKAIVVDFGIRLRGCAKCMRTISMRKDKIWFYHIGTIRRVNKKLRELELDTTDQGQAKYTAYVAERKSNAKAAVVDGQAIRNWEERAKAAKARADRELALSRQRKIEAKFKELGYSDEHFRDYDFWGHSLVTQPRDLTDRIWNTIRAPLTTVLDEIRIKVAKHQLKARQIARQKDLFPLHQALMTSWPEQAQATFPPLPNFVAFDSVRPLWEVDDVKVDEATLEAAKLAISAEAAKFARQYIIATFSRLAKAHTESTANKDPRAPTTYNTGASHSATDMTMLASRVTSSFPCPASSCSHMEPFPGILAHWRTVHTYYFTPSSYDMPTATFSDATLRTSGDQIKTIRLILQAVDKDPSLPSVSEATTTAAELDAVGARFECVDCPGARRRMAQPGVPATLAPPRLRTWSDLVLHTLDGHSSAHAYAPSSGPHVPPKIKIHSLPPPPTPAPASPAAAETPPSAVKVEDEVKSEVEIEDREEQEDGAEVKSMNEVEEEVKEE